jgi:hypothetical protein
MNFQELVLISPLSRHHGTVFLLFDVIGLILVRKETPYSSDVRTRQIPAICGFRPLLTALAQTLSNTLDTYGEQYLMILIVAHLRLQETDGRGLTWLRPSS